MLGKEASLRFLKAVIGSATAVLLTGCFTTSTTYLPPPAPTNLAYAQNPATYTKSIAIAPNTPSHGGGEVTIFAVSPALPPGLALDAATGLLSGTPTAVSATADYTVVARNSGGSTSAVLTLTVNDTPPSNLVYTSATVQYTRGFAITPNTPTSSGGPVTNYSVAPALPAGLSLNPATGILSGTPSVVAPAATYTVTASNSGGSTSTTLTITVIDIAPTSLGYTTNPAVYNKGIAIAPNTPVHAGGPPVSYAVSPALPPGLTMDPSTGILTGTPLTITPLAGYTVTATNTGGSTTATLILTVNDTPPLGLTYSSNPAVYTLGQSITANVATCGGGTVLSYGISPPLPTGLTLNSTTGVISGTPLALSPQTTYTVTATNTGGSAQAALILTVNDVPPSSLAYTANPATYTRGTAIAPNLPGHVGGPIVAYSITPALPPGLGFNTATGVVSGTPTLVTGTTNYLVTALNSGGSTSVTLTLTVNDIPPSALAYSSSPAVYTKGVAIAPNTPTSAGGPVVTYTISPGLPAGLSMNSGTGVISGTPTVLFPPAAFTVTASNSGGTSQAFLTLSVIDLPPANLTYPFNPVVYTKGTPITPNTPSSSGGAVVSYSVSPVLPPGLVFDTATGTISGTPSTIQVSATYTVTATNTGGSTTAALQLTVNDAPPTNLTYSANPAVYQKGVGISPNAPSNGGGAVLSYSVSPFLPAGLSLHPTTGIITGTPAAITATAGYLVTATNSGGTTTVLLMLTVNDLPPTSLSYSSPNVIYAKSVPIANNTPTTTGGAVTLYTVSPALPPGILLNAATGVINGTPTAPSPATTYTVTASNSGGSVTAAITIQVKDAAPTNLVYASNPVTYTKGLAIAPNIPSNSGGVIVTYTVNPPLPVGLALDPSTGILSGTPAVIVTNQGCTVTGVNSGGSTSVLLTITVKDVAPSNLVYPTNPAVYTRGTNIAPNTPTYSGGTVTSWTVSPGLPGGLALNTSTGAIYGTPTVTTPAADYVVTATNSGGSTNATVNITVNDPPLAPPSLSLDAFVSAGREALLARTQDQGRATKYHWILRGGTLTSGQGTPTITYTAGAAGQLEASVRVTRLAQSMEGSATATIEPLPEPELDLPDLVVPGIGELQGSVSALKGASYRWSIRPESTRATLQGGQGTERVSLALGTEPGTFQVEVNLQNRAGDHGTARRSIELRPGLLEAVDPPEHTGGALTLLIDGRVRLAGGSPEHPGQLFDPTSRTWTTPTPEEPLPEEAPLPPRLPDGRIASLEATTNGLRLALFDPFEGRTTTLLVHGVHGRNAALIPLPQGLILLVLELEGTPKAWLLKP